MYNTNPNMYDPETAAALDVARGLVASGVPVFVAPPAGPDAPDHWRKIGFYLPKGWQETVPDPAVVDTWRPGWALCAVMGVAMDCLDVDPRSGGALPREIVDDTSPYAIAGATTPSGGFHLFVTPLGEGSRDGIYPGVDLKGGMPDGTGRGFAFLAPTVKISKASGQPASYHWVQAPGYRTPEAGRSELLAAQVRAMRASSSATKPATAASLEGLEPELAAYVRQVDQGEPHSSAVADRVIASKLDEVRNHGAVEGTGFRNTLMRAAMTLGGYVGGEHLTMTDAEERLMESVVDCWGTCDDNDWLWIRQGLTDGASRPFNVYAAHDVSAAPGEAPGEAERKAWMVYDVIGTHPFDPHEDETDQGYADKVLERVYPAMRAGVDSGTWVVRGPEVWEERGEMAGWAVSAVARLMPLGKLAGPDEEKGPAHWQAKRRKIFHTSAGRNAIASTMRDITRGADHFAALRLSDLDADPEVLWAGGVPWDLRLSGEQPVVSHLDPGTPHLHAAKVAPALVPTPAWNAYLATVWPDAEVRAWALRVLSIAATGYPDAALPVLYGRGRTGKSATVALLMDLLGTYAHAADPRLLAGADNAHASVVYALKGRRLSFIDEGPRKGALAAERLKQLTGGAALTGNAMRANPVTFNPTHTLVMSTNDEPQIADAALRARMRIIPCEADREAVAAARAALTPAVWRDEAPGVLAMVMREAALWLDDRRSASTAAAPMTVQAVVDEIAEEQDVFAQWLTERTTPDATGTPSRTLYNAFAVWFEDSPLRRRERIPTETAWGRALSDLGFPSRHVRTGKVRDLKITNGGDVSWVTNLPVTGVVTGDDGSAESTGHADSGRSAQGSESSVTGVTGFGSTIHSNKKHTQEKNIGENRGNGVTPATPSHSPANSAPDLGKQGVTGPVTGLGVPVTCSVCSAEPGVTTQGKLRSHKVDGAKCSGSGAAVAGFVTPAQQARAEKVAALAGEILELPAAMVRGGAPRSVDLAEASAILRRCLERNGGTLAVDIETNALPEYDPRKRVTSIQLGDWQEAVDLDPDDMDQRAIAGTFIAEAAELNAHSYTADLAPLARMGVITDYAAVCAKTVDTATRAKLADPNLTDNGDGLKELAQTMLGERAEAPAAEAAKDELGKAAGWIWKLKPDTPESKNGWLQIDKRCATMVRYALSDVLDCAALRRMLPEPTPELDARERLAQRVTAVAPLKGVRLDAGAVAAQLADREPRAAEKLARINALGVANPDSPKQVTTRLTELGAVLPQTDSGNASAKGDVLEKLTEAPGELGELATMLLAYRDDSTVLKNMIRPWSRSTQGGDSRTYPTIYTLGADTGRMSCVRPNLQQVAREGGLRECLVADEGYKIIAADFSSVEVRVAAALSQDPLLVGLLNESRTCATCLSGATCVKHDLHSLIANEAFGPGFTKAQRYGVKRIVFGRLYGGGLDTLARQAGLDHATTQRLIDILDAMTPGLAKWSREVKAAVKAGHTQYTTYSGRVIHLDPKTPHKAPNYLIQGTARELLIDALVRWDAGAYAGGVLLPVHDEIVVMVRAEDADAAVAYLGECMTTELYGVPIVAEADAPMDQWASAA